MASKSSITVRILGNNKDLKGSLADSESAIGEFAGKAGKIGLGAATAVGGAVVIGLTKGFTDALDAQSNQALIASQLGISPADAAELATAAAAVYRSAWGASLADATQVTTSVSLSFDGLTPAELEGITGQAFAMADAFGIDVTQGIQTASEMVEAGLVGSADEAFDLLTRGLQEMPPAIRDELLAASNEYGDFFGALGISGDAAFAQLTEFAEGGIYGIDKFGDALKELTIRGTDMSTASVAAYQAAGLNAEEMAARMLEGGDTARLAVEETAAALLSIEDPTERANAAIALFGTPLEDLSVQEIPGFLEGLTDLSSGLDGVEGAADQVADTMGGTASSRLEAFKRQALGGLADFAANHLLPRFEQLLDWFERSWPGIERVGREVLAGLRDGWDRYGRPTVDTIRQAVGAVIAWWQQNWPAIRETVTEVLDAVRRIVEATVTAVMAAWDMFGDDLITAAKAAWDAIRLIVEGAVKIVRGVIKAVTALIRGDWSAVWTGLRMIVDGVWKAIVGIVKLGVTAVRLALAAGWDLIRAGAKAAWDGIKSLVSGAVDAVVGFVAGIGRRVTSAATTAFSGLKGAATGAKNWVSDRIDEVVGFARALPGRMAGLFVGMWDGIKTAFRSAINFVIRGWNRLEFKIPGFSFGPISWDGFTLGVPDIPQFHSGGVVPGRPGEEVLAVLLAGERVLPVSESRQSITSAASVGPVGGGWPDELTLVIEGRPFRAMLAEHDRQMVAALSAGVR